MRSRSCSSSSRSCSSSTPAPVLLALLILLAAAAGPATVAASALVEHSLDAGRSFTRAGEIHLQDDVSSSRASSSAVWGTYEREPLSDRDRAQLEQLVQDDRLYLWRVQLPGQPPVLTSIRAACLAAAYAAPELALQVDEAGHIVAAGISVPPAVAPEGSCSVSQALQALKELTATQPGSIAVAVHTPAPGSVVPRSAEVTDLFAAPGTQTAAQKQAAQKQQAAAAAAARQRQQQQQQQGQAGAAGGAGAGAGEGQDGPPEPPVDDRTWLQKNYLIVMMGVTLVLNIVMRGFAGPEGGPPVPGAAGGGQVRAPGQQRRAQ